MKRIKILLILLLLLGITPITTGCSNNSENKQEAVKQESRGVVDDFSDQLFLNGKQVKVPTSLNDLGDDYTYGDKISYIDFENDDGTLCTQGDLFYKEEPYARITLYNTSKNEMDENSVIYEIRFKDSDTGDYALQNLKKGASKEEIEKALGKPAIDGEGILQYFNEYDKEAERKYNRIVIHIKNDKMAYFIIGKKSED